MEERQQHYSLKLFVYELKVIFWQHFAERQLSHGDSQGSKLAPIYEFLLAFLSRKVLLKPKMDATSFNVSGSFFIFRRICNMQENLFIL